MSDKKLLKLLGVVMSTAIAFLLTGIVFMYLWNNIIVITFGFKALNIAESVGMLLIVEFLLYKQSKNNDISLLEAFIGMVIANLWFLGLGFLVVLFL